MTFFEAFHRFWQVDQQAAFSGTETKMYFAIVKVANDLHWKHEQLHIPNMKLMGMMNCTIKTLERARHVLANHNLIEYIPGKNGREAPTYTLLNEDSTPLKSTAVESAAVKIPKKFPNNVPHIKDKDKDKNNNEYKNPETEQKHEKVYDFFRTHFKNHERIIKFLKQEEGLGEEFELFMEYCLEGNEWGKYISKAKAPVKYILSIADKQWPYYQVWKGQQYKEATDFAGIGAFNISHVGYG